MQTPGRHRFRARPIHPCPLLPVLILLLLALPSLTGADAARATPSAAGVGQDPPQEEQKQKVEKPETRHRDSDKDRDRRSEDADESDDNDDCFTNCFADVFSSMIADLFSSDEPQVEDEATPVTPADSLLVGGLTGGVEAPGAATAPSGSPGAAAPVAATPTAYPPFRLGFLARGDVTSLIGPSDARDEFKDYPLIRYGLQVMWRPSGVLLDLKAAYGERDGKPRYDFMTSTILDSPQAVNLRLFDLALRVGQAYPLGSQQTLLCWGVGPRLAWVRETALIDVYALPGPILQGERRESLERWRLGGEVSLGVLYRASGVVLGLQTSVAVTPWTSDEEKSLVLDFIGDRSLVTYGVSVLVGYDAF